MSGDYQYEYELLVITTIVFSPHFFLVYLPILPMPLKNIQFQVISLLMELTFEKFDAKLNQVTQSIGRLTTKQSVWRLFDCFCLGDYSSNQSSNKQPCKVDEDQMLICIFSEAVIACWFYNASGIVDSAFFRIVLKNVLWPHTPIW